mmetsp:Transcript_16847/g.63907  ORF Transcript_16847/g.63907 Transcript_16847/m.63907 type:complete len:280 (+) Transcript_16847:670-1509(+)
MTWTASWTTCVSGVPQDPRPTSPLPPSRRPSREPAGRRRSCCPLISRSFGLRRPGAAGPRPASSPGRKPGEQRSLGAPTRGPAFSPCRTASRCAATGSGLAAWSNATTAARNRATAAQPTAPLRLGGCAWLARPAALTCARRAPCWSTSRLTPLCRAMPLASRRRDGALPTGRPPSWRGLRRRAAALRCFAAGASALLRGRASRGRRACACGARRSWRPIPSRRRPTSLPPAPRPRALLPTPPGPSATERPRGSPTTAWPSGGGRTGPRARRWAASCAP